MLPKEDKIILDKNNMESPENYCEIGKPAKYSLKGRFNRIIFY